MVIYLEHLSVVIIRTSLVTVDLDVVVVPDQF